MMDSGEPLVNLSYLREYTDDDPGSLNELIEVFCETFFSDLDILKNNITDGENKEWSAVAHKLKGAAGYVGAEKLKYLCALAQDVHTGSLADRASLYQQIKDTYNAVRIFLEGECRK